VQKLELPIVNVDSAFRGPSDEFPRAEQRRLREREWHSDEIKRRRAIAVLKCRRARSPRQQNPLHGHDPRRRVIRQPPNNDQYRSTLGLERPTCCAALDAVSRLTNSAT
jgi:hypothetical protein